MTGIKKYYIWTMKYDFAIRDSYIKSDVPKETVADFVEKM